jgi:hypothetical protein
MSPPTLKLGFQVWADSLQTNTILLNNRSNASPNLREVEDQKTFAYRWREEVKTLKAENAELQKKQATHEITACYFPKKGEADLTWDKLWDGSHFGITIKVTEEQGNQLAKTVPACVVMRGIVKKGGEG